MELSCPDCDRSFQSQKRFNDHVKRAHATLSERTCPHCGATFADRASVPRHLRRCPKRPAVAVKCVLPPSSVPTSTSSPGTKTRSPKQNFPTVERYLPVLAAYLARGGFIHTFPTRHNELASLTIKGYISFIRKYLEAIVEGLEAGRATSDDEEREAEPEDATFKTVLLLSIQLEHISTFLRHRQQDDFKARTQVNCMSALLWHLVFVKFLTYPDLTTASFSPTEHLLRRIFSPSFQIEVTALGRQLDESHRYLRQQIARTAEDAEQQVKSRNSREALQAKGTWISLDWLTTVARALDDEGWARMRRLETVLQSTNLRALIGVKNQYRAQFDWLRNWIVFSLFVDIPPMRPQNGVLQVMTHTEPVGSRKTNGILFLQDRAWLQIVHFKNARFTGEHSVELPEGLRLKLLAYMQFVRPVYAFRATNTIPTEEEEEEEADSDDDSEEADSGDENEESEG